MASSAMRDALINAGLMSHDISKKCDDPKIKLNISTKEKTRASRKKLKDYPKSKKTQKTPIKKTSKTSSKKIIVKPVKIIPDEVTAVGNLSKLGFSKLEDALDYWNKVNKNVKGKTKQGAVTSLNSLGIMSPKGTEWNVADFEKFLRSVERVLLHLKESGSLDGLTNNKGSLLKKEIEKASSKPFKNQQNNESMRGVPSFEDMDTDTLFKKYREALVSLSKNNPNLSKTANKTIESINKEFLRRFDGKINKEGYFVWPSTKVYASHLGLSNKLEWEKNGVLSLYGYRVGATRGEPISVRREILNEVFKTNIPPVLDFGYIKEWGNPKSAARLQKMANTLASMARLEKYRGNLFAVAYEHREEDLRYLHNKYYVGKFGFSWPDT